MPDTTIAQEIAGLDQALIESLAVPREFLEVAVLKPVVPADFIRLRFVIESPEPRSDWRGYRKLKK